jgi:HD-like signal output (HDOD) protein
MIIGAALALLLVGAIFGVLLGRRRPAGTAARAVATAADTDRASDAETAGTGPSAGSLRSEQQAVTAALWRCALGLGDVLPTMPAGHVAIGSASLAALQAEKLADRYFPRRPLLMPQLQAAVNSAATSTTRLADIIAQDPVLAGSILRLANSVFYRLSNKPVESIQRAVVVCGTDGLQSLAATALMQPVFSGGGDAHSQFPAMLWERCTRASVAAEMLARSWCPADRQIAQLLALVAALGPLVVYRVVQDQYRAAPALQPAPVLFLSLIEAQADRMSQRVAELWQSSPRMIAALEIAYLPGEASASADASARPLADTLLAGELLAALSLLRQRQLRSDEECQQHAASAGVPSELFTAVWERLLRDAGPG